MKNTKQNAEAALARGQITPGPWRYEASTKTIRAVPANYWLATMDSWEGAINNDANARLIAAAPDLLEALNNCVKRLEASQPTVGTATWETIKQARAALDRATNTNTNG